MGSLVLQGPQRGITLGLVQHVDDLSQRVVIAVDTTCPPKRPYARLDRAFGERIETYWVDSTGRRNTKLSYRF